ncbi:GMC family oxidoreductase N-terminal domain-containing protein, partial [Alphaproteobacteria bacterium]|nr:GMC family oxidoreductase N-terminal domain-containing protein [Alphaproteobacteria bacterium]
MAEFDYIIVGAGSAGSALAARLSEKQDSQVLLLEAGPSGRHPFLHIPIGYGKVFYDQRYNWKYHTNPEPHLNNRSIYWPRGKVLGGSSSINAMVYVRGHKQDYDEWNAVAPGWGWADVEPMFRRM